MDEKQRAVIGKAVRELVALDKAPVRNLANVAVEFNGDKIQLPNGMTTLAAIETLIAFEESQEKVVQFAEVFKVFPWDGAHALSEVLKTRFGWTEAKDRPGFFGDTPPTFQQIEVGPNLYKTIAWGDFGLPGIPATLQTHAERQGNGQWYFKVVAKAKKKAEPIVQAILEDVRQFLRRGGSIYQGQAVKLSLENDLMPEPSFMDTDKIDVSNMMFSRRVSDALRTNVFTPISRVQDLLSSGLPFKRGVLFAGTYGTGKTLAASAAAKVAVQNGVTFLYIKEASQLAAAVDFAKMYATPAAVIFCEDVDRETEGERDEEMDALLNIIDGIDTKAGNIMVVLTTNNWNAIHPAMLREGRLDAVIEFTPPDAETAERIIRSYAGDTLDATEDLSEVGKLCDGQIPATLAEVVKRAKLAQLSLQPAGTVVSKITAEALRLSAESMLGQIALRERRIKEEAAKENEDISVDDLIRQAVVEALGNGAGEALFTPEKLKKIGQAVRAAL